LLVAPRTRRARAAALAVALAAPAVLGTAAPAFASAGGSAVVSAVVSDGNVHVQSTKGLSRVTVVLCDGHTVVADSWAGEQLSGDIAVDGIVEAVFIHSGDNTTDDAQALLALLAGADEVQGDSTGAVALYDADACKPEVVVPPGGNQNNDDQNQNQNNNNDDQNQNQNNNDGGTAGPNGTSDPVSDPSVDPTLIIHSDPAPPTTTTGDPAPAANPPADTTVLGATLERPVLPTTGSPAADPAVTPAAAPAVESSLLAHTGSDHTQDLLLFGLGCLGAGVLALAAGRRRRPTSASSAG